jgi:hypothetical protein
MREEEGYEEDYSTQYDKAEIIQRECNLQKISRMSLHWNNRLSKLNPIPPYDSQ